MARPLLTGILLSALSFAAVPTLGADLENGQKLARKCSACHGKDGLSKVPDVPNLAGQPAPYLEKSLKAFRDGKREDRRMTLMAEPLSDAEIKDLAAWYSSFELTVQMPN